MEKQLEPRIYPFLSKTEKYCFFATLERFGKMKTILLLDNNHDVVKELNSDDFVFSRGFRGTDESVDERGQARALYYKSEVPVLMKIIMIAEAELDEELQRRIRETEEQWAREAEERIKKHEENAQ